MKLDSHQFNVNIEKKEKNYARVSFSPLLGGFGHTLGNSLRRVLLITIPGAAITKIKAKGAQHLFSSLPKVKEDLVEISLNLKKIRFSYHGEDTLALKLNKKGQGKVTAADIKLPPNVKIANPDQYIAEVSDDKGSLDMELTISSGVGYLSAKEIETSLVGEIPIDATFSPITKVSYEVQPARLGKKSDFDRLILEIWSDGSIEPTEALKKAAQDLEASFRQIVSPEKVDTQDLAGVSAPIPPQEDELLVEEIELPLRVTNALKKAGYHKISDLIKAGRAKVSHSKNVGEKSLKLIDKWLTKKELAWTS